MKKVPELTTEELLMQEIQELKSKVLHLESTSSKKELQSQITELSNTLNKTKFTLDRFKHNKAHFKFYTGFESYELFCVVVEYLQPAASCLNYWGSSTIVNKTDSNQIKKRSLKNINTGRRIFYDSGMLAMCFSC